MTPESAMTIGRQALEITFMVSAPLLLSALATGLLVSIFQAATQINEMTLSFIPKLLVMFLVMVLAGPWMINIMTAELNTLLATFLWPLSRILALVATAPILGNPSIPVRVKLGLAIMITILVAPTVEQSLPQIDPSSGIGLIILLQQVMIGIAIGFVMRI